MPRYAPIVVVVVFGVAKRFGDLERAIDGIVASYTGALEIDNLESAALPNKRAVIEALGHFEAMLFTGFYSTRQVTKESLRHAIAEHAYEAHVLLAEQIERALLYEGRTCVHGELAESIVLELFDWIPSLRVQLNADITAAFEGDPAAKSIEEVVFSYPSVEALVAYRIAHRLHLAGVPMIPRILTEHAHARTGIDISPGATIGARFFIDHGTGVVIGETAVIGNDVKIYQGVTLGALSVTKRTDIDKRHPTIEDRVTIYAGATILGGSTVIGESSVIGGNVWLTKSVPPGSRVFGKGRNDEEE